MEKTHRQIMSERARRLRKEMTRQERKLWYQFLLPYEFPFVTQKVMGNYILDFYCKRLHLSMIVFERSTLRPKESKSYASPIARLSRNLKEFARSSTERRKVVALIG